jgi:AcrR family transcriptional regulator
VATRHFYEEFEGKEALLTALFDEVTEQCIALIEQALVTAPDDPEVRARASLGAMIHHLLDDPRRARIQSMEVVGVSAGMEAHRRSVLHRYAEIVEDEARRIGLPSPPGRRYSLRALALVAATNELMIEWIGDTSRSTIDELVEEFVSLYLAVGRSTLLRAPR